MMAGGVIIEDRCCPVLGAQNGCRQMIAFGIMGSVGFKGSSVTGSRFIIRAAGSFI
jgi:hypothetical protein